MATTYSKPIGRLTTPVGSSIERDSGRTEQVFAAWSLFVLDRAVTVVAMLLVLLSTVGISAAEAPTEEVIQLCRKALSAEKGAVLIDRWSTKPLPADYQRVAQAALVGTTVRGWLTHKNPNGTISVIIDVIYAETHERSFIVLFRDKKILSKRIVSAFEFALSHSSYDGVTGLYFCGKTGPSAEWVWDRGDWKIAK
jgi:hypothetical protein